jgi:hypothetical protein
VIDTAFDVIDELTRERGPVISEAVPRYARPR